MFRSRKNSNETAKHELKPTLRLLWRKLRHWRLLADDLLQLGHKVDHEPSIRTQRLVEGVAPSRQIGFALREKVSDQALKGLCQGRVGNVAFVLIELAGCEKAARRYQHRLQLADDRGLADAGIAGDQDQFRGTIVDDAIEGGEQGLDLASPPVELLGNQQPVGRVVFAERKVVNPPLHLPFGLTAAKV